MEGDRQRKGQNIYGLDWSIQGKCIMQKSQLHPRKLYSVIADHG